MAGMMTNTPTYNSRAEIAKMKEFTSVSRFYGLKSDLDRLALFIEINYEEATFEKDPNGEYLEVEGLIFSSVFDNMPYYHISKAFPAISFVSYEEFHYIESYGFFLKNKGDKDFSSIMLKTNEPERAKKEFNTWYTEHQGSIQADVKSYLIQLAQANQKGFLL